MSYSVLACQLILLTNYFHPPHHIHSTAWPAVLHGNGRRRCHLCRVQSSTWSPQWIPCTLHTGNRLGATPNLAQHAASQCRHRTRHVRCLLHTLCTAEPMAEGLDNMWCSMRCENHFSFTPIKLYCIYCMINCNNYYYVLLCSYLIVHSNIR